MVVLAVAVVVPMLADRQRREIVEERYATDMLAAIRHPLVEVVGRVPLVLTVMVILRQAVTEVSVGQTLLAVRQYIMLVEAAEEGIMEGVRVREVQEAVGMGDITQVIRAKPPGLRIQEAVVVVLQKILPSQVLMAVRVL